MIKEFIENYLWFWKESNSFMKGHNRLYITLACIFKAPKFAIDMVRWNKLTREQKWKFYMNIDRTI